MSIKNHFLKFMQVTALATDLSGMAMQYKENLNALHNYKASNEVIVRQHKGDYLTAEQVIKKHIKSLEKKIELAHSFKQAGSKKEKKNKKNEKTNKVDKNEKLKKFKENKAALEKSKAQKLKENKAALEKSKMQQFQENKKDILGTKKKANVKTEKTTPQLKPKPTPPKPNKPGGLR